MDFNLAGRIAVVTGGSKGIGLAVVRLLAASHKPVTRPRGKGDLSLRSPAAVLVLLRHMCWDGAL
jgi:NAD(P)-dependent dehydrogenase (short-subunit alcohol dehydrogenase family)